MWQSGVMCLLMMVMKYYSINAQNQQACAIPSLCNDLTIDPRIQTPTQGIPTQTSQPPQTSQLPQISQPPQTNIVTPTTCPSGYILCRNIRCGVSSNPVQASDQNGDAKRLAFPWHVFIQDGTRASERPGRGYAGGGVLISPRYVVTAAHKISNLTRRAINVRMGLYNIDDEQNVQTRVVSSIHYHSGYNRDTLKNDIAILQLQQPINLDNNANVMCLPTAGRNYQGTSNVGNCWVAGFGQIEFSSFAPHSLKQIKVPIVTNDMCIRSFQGLSIDVNRYLDFPGEICAGGELNVDACTQDGGSGLVCRDTGTSTFNLVGLVNWGKNCGRANVYGVYVNIPYYVDWINRIITCYNQGTLGSTDCSRFEAILFY
ncbi:unnamed protein product [Phaedon cochleariae]|uniref:Peptidase S1 domain-containing protein n=1 Tax=Phaedon cochleariae TaxID=80249 RepID=A0A9P0DLX6_PHACE|nr:unnamed protein product [Phaedon cochleariae]